MLFLFLLIGFVRGDSISDEKFFLKNYEFVNAFEHPRVRLSLSERSTKARDPRPLQFRAPRRYHRRLQPRKLPSTWTDTEFDWREEVLLPDPHHQLSNECFAEAASTTLTALWQTLFDDFETSFFDPDALVKCAGDIPGKTALPEDVFEIKEAVSPDHTCHTHNNEKAMLLAEPLILCDLWDSVNIENELMDLLKLAPVSVGLPSTNPAFLNYHSGILETKHVDTPSGAPDHAVALVGFGEEDGIPYWTIRNSWGKDWGELGYARIERKDDGSGVLGSYASVTTATPA